MRLEAGVVVIGGGFVGLSSALALARRRPRSRVVVLEATRGLGAGQSGRNSGVLHGGTYYARGSLKARLSVEGNAMLAEWCERHGVPWRRCGKLILATRGSAGLAALFERGRANGADLQWLDGAAVARRVPQVGARTEGIWVASAGVLDPSALMASLRRAAEDAGVGIHLGAPARPIGPSWLRLPDGEVRAERVVNAAGLGALSLAHAWGDARGWSSAPFRGLYLLGAPSVRLPCHIYPEPEPGMPFLGVHTTVRADGRVMIGPTALATSHAGREGPLERLGRVRTHLGILRGSERFRRLLRREVPLWSRRETVRRARELVPGLRWQDFRERLPSGVRAQLLRSDGELERDFVVERCGPRLHALNVVSPGLTSCLALGDLIAQRLGD